MTPEICQRCKQKDRCNDYKRKRCKKLEQWKNFLKGRRAGMKITCTQEEKEMLIETIVKSTLCPLPASIDCPVEICQRAECEKCMNEDIEWEITE